MSVFEPRTRKSTKGKWKLHNNLPVFEEVELVSTFDSMLGSWSKKKVVQTLYKTPEQMGLVKEILVMVLFREERDNVRKYKGKTVEWFQESFRIKVREDCEWMFLTFQDRHLWLKDLYYGQTCECPLKNSPNVIVTEENKSGEPEYVEKSKLEELIKNVPNLLIYSKKDDDGNYVVELKA